MDIRKLSGAWIEPPRDTDCAAVVFCRDFATEGRVKRATLYVTAVGLFFAELNGQRIGREVMAPGWPSYKNRIPLKEYDLTSLLADGENALRITVGPGWATGSIGIANPHPKKNYADRVKLLAAVEITYSDGRTVCLTSDERFYLTTSPILASDIYDGETVDLTAEARPLGAAVRTSYPARIMRDVGAPICEQERLAPIAVLTTPRGERVIDFGQNLAGYAELRLCGPRGARVVVEHAEILDPDGNFYTDNMRFAACRNTYILSGGVDILKPSFSFQGFRYIRLTEYPLEAIDPNDFRAIAVHSEMERTGHFSCGHPLINQLYHNVIWGQKSNYIDVPTDCPQRNERLGWTGDTQVFCRTAALSFDVERFFCKWLTSMRDEQKADGAVDCYVPWVPGCSRISAAWGDAACIVPYEMYLAYGNRRELARNFPMMKKWVDYMHAAGPREFLWLEGTHFGDWLAKDRTDVIDTNAAYMGKTPTDLIASAYFAYSTMLTVRAGEALGEEIDEYRILYKNVRKAFRAHYIRDKKLCLLPNGWKEGEPIPNDETQTAYALVLVFGLYEGEEERAYFAARLAALVKENGTRLTTGFVGTPYLLHALSQNGYASLSYDLLLQTKNPSWLYSVTKGATTMWEHWDGIREDGSLRNRHMNSFNHYAYGAVYDWIFGVAIGVTPRPDAPAYRIFDLAPHPDSRLGHAEASLKTRSGTLSVRWYYKGERVFYEFDIPKGSVAELTLPSGYRETLTGGSYRFAE